VDEVLQRALRELERSGQRLVTRPPAEVISMLRMLAARGHQALIGWLKENDLQGSGCAICDEGLPAPAHSCIGPTGPQDASPAQPHIHPSQAFPAQPKKEPLIRAFADQRRKPQQQFKPRARRRP